MDETERRVAETLAHEADLAETPPLDAQAFLRAGRREVRRRRVRAGGIVAGVAVLALIATGVGVTGSWWTDGAQPADQGPTTTSPTQTRHAPEAAVTLADLPVGQAPQAPYWSRGWLHIDDKRIQMARPNEVVGNNGKILVFPQHPSGEVDLVVGSQLLQLTEHGSLPVVSPDGHYAAWEIPAGPGQPVVASLWDLRIRSEVGRVTTPFVFEVCCGGGTDTEVRGVDDLGRVYFQQMYVQMWDWRTGEFTKVTGLPHGYRGFEEARGGREIAIVGGGSFNPGDPPPWSVLGTVDDNGVFTRTGRYPALYGLWSSDGRRVLFQDYGGLPWLYDTATHHTLQVTTPSDVHVPEGGVAWEAGASFLVVVRSTNFADFPVGAAGAILRCDGITGNCEVATHVARPEDTALPRPSWIG
jgi:hypothetical protein